jgi:hypothetical protein
MPRRANRPMRAVRWTRGIRRLPWCDATTTSSGPRRRPRLPHLHGSDRSLTAQHSRPSMGNGDDWGPMPPLYLVQGKPQWPTSASSCAAVRAKPGRADRGPHPRRRSRPGGGKRWAALRLQWREVAGGVPVCRWSVTYRLGWFSEIEIERHCSPHDRSASDAAASPLGGAPSPCPSSVLIITHEPSPDSSTMPVVMIGWQDGARLRGTPLCTGMDDYGSHLSYL